MANFKVITDSAGSFDNYTDESRYHFNDAGMLVTVRPDRERRTYSPSGWLHLVDEVPKSKAPRRLI